MPNWLENLRLKNIFGQPGMIGNDLPSQGGITGTMRPPPDFSDMFNRRKNPFEGIFSQSPNTFETEEAPLPETEFDTRKRMGELYTPETEASNRFNQMITEFPERNKPGWLRKIGAGLTAYAHGMPAGERVAFGPHLRKLEDWKEKIGPVEKAAQLERQTNVNERTLAYQVITAELREQALRAKETNDTRRAEIAQQRADVYEHKARNPNLQFNFTGPTVKVTDPSTGKVADTGIPTGSMSEADKLTLQQKQTLERIGATGEERRTTQEEGHEQELTEIEARGEEARRTRITPSGAGTGRAELPTQTRVRQFNAARELLNTRPELKQFIKLGTPGSNDFTITPPGSGFFGPTGPTKEQYEEINAAIYDGALSRAAGNTGAGKQQSIRKTQRNSRTGETRTVESADGGKTWKVVTAGK